MKFNLLLGSVFLLGVTSCTTMNDRQVAAVASQMSLSLMAGDVDALTGRSGTPFLFETEVLPAPVQLEALWAALSASGYDFGTGGVIEVYDPDMETPLIFSSSRDVRVWFERHAPAKTALVVIPNANGKLIVVVDRDRRNPARIRGLKVASR